MLAALIDIGLMLGWALLMGVGQALAAMLGLPIRFGPFGYNLFSLALVVLPVTIAFTVLEAGRYEATPGKLKLGLRVRSDPWGDRLTWPRSLARNLLKLGLPWTLAQSAALALVSDPALDAIAGAAFAAIVPLAYLVSLFMGDGRTIYDWITGTQVITTAAGRRFAAPAPEPDLEPASEPDLEPAPEPDLESAPASNQQSVGIGHDEVNAVPDVRADDSPTETGLGVGRRVQSS
jgi:uncharacterized RDD family membrane protein YckC